MTAATATTSAPEMTSMARVVTTLGHAEPDRVPVFLFFTMHGAKALGIGLREYFSRPERVIEGQLRLWRRFGHDCLYSVTYAAVEHEAFGGDVLFSDDGPPNAGAPVLRHRDEIFALEPPDVARCPALQRGLAVIRGLADAVRGEVPVIGAAVGPASLPVMLLGFARYLELMHEDREAFDRLMAVTTRFCVDWARAQLAAGATALGLFDPLSAVDITDGPRFEELVLPATRAAIGQIPGPVVLHLASGRGLARMDAYAATGAAGLGVSAQEDLAALKRQAAGRVALLGNLNGVTMARWTHEEAAEQVRDSVLAGAPGGGFVLADNHGEIPYQVEDDVLDAIVAAAKRWGTYPIGGGDDGR